MGSESKHTPGPWEVHDDHPERACIYIRQTEATYWADIAALYHAPGEEDEKDITGIWRNDPVRVANARLIAAAPDLLEALMVATREIEYTARDLADSCCLLRDGVRDLTTAEPEDRAEIERLRGLHGQMNAAIAKATGGKP